MILGKSRGNVERNIVGPNWAGTERHAYVFQWGSLDHTLATQMHGVSYHDVQSLRIRKFILWRKLHKVPIVVDQILGCRRHGSGHGSLQLQNSAKPNQPILHFTSPCRNFRCSYDLLPTDNNHYFFMISGYSY